MSTETQHDPSRDNVEISKLVAEMINLIADARKSDAEREKLQIEAQTFKMRHLISAFAAAVGFMVVVFGFVIAMLSFAKNFVN